MEGPMDPMPKMWGTEMVPRPLSRANAARRTRHVAIRSTRGRQSRPMRRRRTATTMGTEKRTGTSDEDAGERTQTRTLLLCATASLNLFAFFLYKCKLLRIKK